MPRAVESNYLCRVLATLRILKTEPQSTPHEVQAALSERGIDENIATIRNRLALMARENVARRRKRRGGTGREPHEYRLSTEFGGLPD